MFFWPKHHSLCFISQDMLVLDHVNPVFDVRHFHGSHGGHRGESVRWLFKLILLPDNVRSYAQGLFVRSSRVGLYSDYFPNFIPDCLRMTSELIFERLLKILNRLQMQMMYIQYMYRLFPCFYFFLRSAIISTTVPTIFINLSLLSLIQSGQKLNS